MLKLSFGNSQLQLLMNNAKSAHIPMDQLVGFHVNEELDCRNKFYKITLRLYINSSVRGADSME